MPRDVVLGRSRAIVARNLALLDAFFGEHPDEVTWVRPRAGSVGFPRLLRGGPIERFAAALVETEGVLILPGPVFEVPR